MNQPYLKEILSSQVVRVGTKVDIPLFLDTLDLDPQAKTDVLDKSQKRDNYLNVFQAPFKRKSKYSVGRFSDGSFPVCYTSRELKTTYKEKAAHIAREEGVPQTFYVASAMFAGDTWNLLNEAKIKARLVSEDYDFCQKLGAEAHENQLDALQTPSSRIAGGINVPIFIESALSDIKSCGTVVLTFTAKDGVQITDSKVLIDPS